jgi:hypothetical protein
MNGQEFVEVLKTVVRDNAVSGELSVLRNPPAMPRCCRARNFPPFPKLALMNEQIPNPPSDPLALGKTLTFEQAEGIEPLRRPLMNAPTAYWMQARDNKAGGK